MHICLARLSLLLLAFTPFSRGVPAQEPWYDSELDASRPMPAEEAAASMVLPSGFHAEVVAAEPLVRNPIAMDWDDRGRLWIAENGTYAEHGVRFDLLLSDRIRILVDRDGDGRADDSRLFADGLKRLTSFATDTDGVWVLCPPQLLFIPDRDRDDVPDGPAEVKLDGFTVPPESYHTIANGLRFGLDGWLYGRCGASSPGSIRRPDQPLEDAVPIAGGLWRFHPTRGTFEVLCHGTTNPWGHDWNATGEAFFINTVNGHLWHAIPGAHFARPHSASPNALVYEPIDTHADHFHWDTSEPWTASRGGTGIHDATGGGHAHSGMSIYLGGVWPSEFHDQLLTLNLHGRRVNRDRLEPHGSGYVGRHTPDPFRSLDPWFRGLDLRYGPDGQVVLIDWSDTGECHEHTGVHRNSGRVFRIVYDEAAPSEAPQGWTAAEGLSGMTAPQLLSVLDHDNQWWVRRARRELLARCRVSSDGDAMLTRLNDWSDSTANHRSSTHRSVDDTLELLRRLGREREPRAATRRDDTLRAALRAEEPAVRVMAVRLFLDHLPLDTVLGEVRAEEELLLADAETLIEMATKDPSPRVRLALASNASTSSP
ncbi:MAG: hypothetical protein R3B96_18400 [Pirellulaceae bacterium]